MTKKLIGFVVTILLVIFALLIIYSFVEIGNDDSKDLKTLYVSSEGPIKLSDIIQDIENASYYDGYDNETLNWMKSLDDKSVFSGEGIFVVMDSHDASKLHSEYITDAYITEEIKCTILENHSLGNIKYPRDILLVKDVVYVGENITNLQGS